MPEPEKTEKSKETWIRQHKIGISAILITLCIGIPSLIGTWLRFPAVARALKLEWLLKEGMQDKENNKSAPDDFNETIENETVVREFSSSAKSRGEKIIIRVTKRSNSPTEFEFFHKTTAAKPFQSFKYGVYVEDIKFDDLNFDSHLDVLIQTSHSVCCVGYAALIYNSQAKTFSPNETLNEGLTFSAGYELDSKKQELSIHYHCPPGNAKAVYKVTTNHAVEGGVTYNPVRYYSVSIHDGTETEVESVESVCSP